MEKTMKYYQNKSIKEWALEDQPREKLIERGVEALTDAELVAILLSSGTRELSAIDLGRKLIEELGGLDVIAGASLDDLRKIHGIGKVKAITLVAAFELGRRKLRMDTVAPNIKSAQDAANILIPRMMDYKHERFSVMCLNNNNDVVGIKLLSVGGITSTVVDTKMVFKEAFDKLASAIILCHNHPSGNVTPSKQDIALTARLVQAGKILEVKVIDHIIVSGSKYFSFADSGEMVG